MYEELFRGIRTHLAKFLISNDNEENIDQKRISMANLGLGHAIARYNIKFDQRKTDKSIINAFSLLDMMDKNLNTFCMRIKEGYGWHFPELSKIVTNNETYVRLVKFIGNKENIFDLDKEIFLSLVHNDEEIMNSILER